MEEIHASPNKAVLVVTGAGTQALAWLMAAPGASDTVLEALVPYGRQAMIEFLGHEPVEYASPEQARDMASRAYDAALRLREDQEWVVGLGCTATIATNRPKLGEHRSHIAIWDEIGVTTYNLTLAKGQRGRSAEEELVSRLILSAMAESFAIKRSLTLDLTDGDGLEIFRARHDDPLRSLLHPSVQSENHVSSVTVYPDGRMVANDPPKAAVLSGSFDPPHVGHEKLAQIGAETLGTDVVFEISVVNVDKPPLEEDELRRRLGQFHGKRCVVVTTAPTFTEKADILPGGTFIIGWDTAVRLVDSKYHGGEAGVLAALSNIRDRGCRFLVAGREHGGVFRTLEDVPIPSGFEDLFYALQEAKFREDTSSAEIRSGRFAGFGVKVPKLTDF